MLRWRAPGPPSDRVSLWLPLSQQAAPLAGQAGAAGIPADRGTGAAPLCVLWPLIAIFLPLCLSLSVSPSFASSHFFAGFTLKPKKGELSPWYTHRVPTPNFLPLRVARQVEII
jgi:hypothetical protein